jgi:hypothetical protein
MIIGHPKLQFEECSECTKRRKTQDLRQNHSQKELMYTREKEPKIKLRHFSKDTLEMLEGPIIKRNPAESDSSSDDSDCESD